ncbi:hypothetical protein CBR_g16858 [Chara braunii]|uniref:Protein kinase domain-containing protein n=1 Tax=Chara braunii TaxID=69332 RepID=A0A388KTX4_CHABU|nr:hypothetical protein CBR_g16858 [Chara braunii]|eukprot:GBG73515.1 hypothetical protein CBR_g16858 [Chara braunii]
MRGHPKGQLGVADTDDTGRSWSESRCSARRRLVGGGGVQASRRLRGAGFSRVARRWLCECSEALAANEGRGAGNKQSNDRRRWWWMDLWKGRHETADFSVSSGEQDIVDRAMDTKEARVSTLVREGGEVVEVESAEGVADGSAKIVIVFARGDCARDHAIELYIIKFLPIYTREKDVEGERGDERASCSMWENSDHEAGGVEMVEEGRREGVPSVKEWGLAYELLKGCRRTSSSSSTAVSSSPSSWLFSAHSAAATVFVGRRTAKLMFLLMTFVVVLRSTNVLLDRDLYRTSSLSTRTKTAGCAGSLARKEQSLTGFVVSKSKKEKDSSAIAHFKSNRRTAPTHGHASSQPEEQEAHGDVVSSVYDKENEKEKEKEKEKEEEEEVGDEEQEEVSAIASLCSRTKVWGSLGSAPALPKKIERAPLNIVDVREEEEEEEKEEQREKIDTTARSNSNRRRLASLEGKFVLDRNLFTAPPWNILGDLPCHRCKIEALLVSRDERTIYFSQVDRANNDTCVLRQAVLAAAAPSASPGSLPVYNVSRDLARTTDDGKITGLDFFEPVGNDSTTSPTSLLAGVNNRDSMWKIDIATGEQTDFITAVTPAFYGLVRHPTEAIVFVGASLQQTNKRITKVELKKGLAVESVLSADAPAGNPASAGSNKPTPYSGPLINHGSLSSNGSFLYIADDSNSRIVRLNTLTNLTETIAFTGWGTRFDPPFAPASTVLSFDGCNLFMTGLRVADLNETSIQWLTFVEPNGQVLERKVVATFRPPPAPNAADASDPNALPDRELNGLTRLALSTDEGHLYVGTENGEIFLLELNRSALHRCGGGEQSRIVNASGSLSSPPPPPPPPPPSTTFPPAPIPSGSISNTSASAPPTGPSSSSPSPPPSLSSSPSPPSSLSSSPPPLSSLSSSPSTQFAPDSPPVQSGLPVVLAAVLVGVLIIVIIVVATLVSWRRKALCFRSPPPPRSSPLPPPKPLPPISAALPVSRSPLPAGSPLFKPPLEQLPPPGDLQITSGSAISSLTPVSDVESGSLSGYAVGAVGLSLSFVTRKLDNLDAPRPIPFADLSKATDGFSSQYRVAGASGGFGDLYRARLKIGDEEEVDVALKMMRGKFSEMKRKQFIAEVTTLSSARHAHLCKLLGFCLEGSIAILVYPFIPGGSLHDRLHHDKNSRTNASPSCSDSDSESQTPHPPPPPPPPSTSTSTSISTPTTATTDTTTSSSPSPPDPLDWRSRVLVAHQIAIALRYLHEELDPPLLHRDVKSNNVLVEGTGDHVRAYLTDFGLARLGNPRLKGQKRGRDTVQTTYRAGTIGYMAPEYAIELKLTAKNDVYAFGVILLELVTGKKAIFYAKVEEGEWDSEGPTLSEETVLLARWCRRRLQRLRHCHYEAIADMVDGHLLSCFKIQGVTEWDMATLCGLLKLGCECTEENASRRPAIGYVLETIKALVEESS